MKCLPHTRGVYNKAPFLTVGGSLFSVPGSSHRADQFHDERTDAACRRSHASKYGQSPGAVVVRPVKCRNTAHPPRAAVGGRVFTSITNFGNAPVALPDGSVVLASGPLTPEGQLPTDTSAWVIK